MSFSATHAIVYTLRFEQNQTLLPRRTREPSMKGPEAPFLEVNFYFADIPDAAAFVRVLAALTSEGAQFIGNGLVHRVPQINLRPFGGITDESSEWVPIASLQEAEAHATAVDTRLVQVDMTGASTALRRGRELVAYVDISPEAAAVDHHPIAIWSTGTLLSGPAGKQHDDKQQRRQRQQFGTRSLQAVSQTHSSASSLRMPH